MEEPVSVTAERGELAHSMIPLCSKSAALAIVSKEDKIFAKTMDIISPPSLGQINLVVHAWPRLQQIVSAVFGNFPL